VLASLMAAAFSYAGRRSLAQIHALAPQIQRRKATYRDDRNSLQRSSLQLYRRQSINPWLSLSGLIPAAIEVGV